jgi:uncharacterized small protein (DUF1192 family)
MKADLLLTEEFTRFSAQIAELHIQQKEANAAFKKVYDDHRAHLKEISDKAAALQAEFDTWAAEPKKKAPKDES